MKVGYEGNRKLILVIGDKIRKVMPGDILEVEEPDMFTGKHGNKLLKKREVKTR